MSEPLPLDGVGVVDVSGPIGAYCSRLLADLGASVTVVEPAGGDELRRRPPFRGVDAAGPGLAFLYYHGDKRLAALDLEGDEAEGELAALASGADVVLVSPSQRPCVGLDPASGRPSWAASDAVVCAITPFGLGGPYRGRRATHLVSFAMSGAMYRMGPPEGPPLVVPGLLHWDLAGAHAAFAILAALNARSRLGAQTLDISAQEVESLQEFHFERFDLEGAAPVGRTIPVGIPPTGTWSCADGPFDVSAHQPHHWRAFLRMLDDPPELGDPALADMLCRRQRAEELSRSIAALLAPRRRGELLARGQAVGLPVSLLNTPGEFVADEQLAARGSLVEIDDGHGGRVRVPASPLRGSRPLTRARGLPARPGSTPAPASPPRDDTAGLLGGLRVLSFGTFVAGNTAAALLASLGAEVVKIEARSRPEVLRNPGYGWGPGSPREPSGVPTSAMYTSLARGARGLSLEIQCDAGRDLFHRLVGEADVVIENFGSSSMGRWGCGYDVLRERNPRLVMLSLSGYGRTGPRAGYRAYAANICNFTGLTRLWTNSGILSDYLSAVHGALAVVAAGRTLAVTGEGVHLDVAQIEVMAAVLAPVLLEPLADGRDAVARGNDIPGSLLSGVVRCRGEDRWLALELTDLADWHAAVQVVERPDLDVASPGEAAEARPALGAAIAAWASEISHHSAAQRLQRAGLAAGAVQDGEDMVRDPQLRQRGFPARLPHPDLGELEYCGSPIRSRPCPSRFEWVGPRLGQDTAHILRAWLGSSDEELRELEARGAIFCA